MEHRAMKGLLVGVVLSFAPVLAAAQDVKRETVTPKFRHDLLTVPDVQ